MTFFDNVSSNRSSTIIQNNTLIATKRLIRGEFIIEITGKLLSSSGEKSVKLGENIFLDISLSNIGRIADKCEANSIPVRVFSYKDNRIVCRLLLFAKSEIDINEGISLNKSLISGFNSISFN